MKAKSRKRLLISSIAMLLVAMIALGTATFAWFTTSTSATADGIHVETVKSSNLKISRYDHNWVDSFSYNHNSALYKPTSSANGSDWYTAVAGSKSTYEKKDGTIVKELEVFANDASRKDFGELDIQNRTSAIFTKFFDYLKSENLFA